MHNKITAVISIYVGYTLNINRISCIFLNDVGSPLTVVMDEPQSQDNYFAKNKANLYCRQIEIQNCATGVDGLRVRVRRCYMNLWSNEWVSERHSTTIWLSE